MVVLGIRSVTAGVGLLLGTHAVIFGAEPLVQDRPSRSVSEGVYAAPQAERGQAEYDRACSACHLADLRGNGMVPALIARTFVSDWGGRSLKDLYTRIAETMPADAPGSLTQQNTLEIVAYLLQMNKYPAGKKELDAESLDQIVIPT